MGVVCTTNRLVSGSSLIYKFYRGKAENGTHKMVLLHYCLKLFDKPLFGFFGEMSNEGTKDGV